MLLKEKFPYEEKRNSKYPTYMKRSENDIPMEIIDKVTELKRSTKEQQDELEMLENFLKSEEKRNYEVEEEKRNHELEDEKRNHELEALKRSFEEFAKRSYDELGIEEKRNHEGEKRNHEEEEKRNHEQEKRNHEEEKRNHEEENFLKRALDLVEKRGADRHSSRVLYKRNANMDPMKMLGEIYERAKNNYKQ